MKKGMRFTNVKSIVIIMMVVVALAITIANLITTAVKFGGNTNKILQDYMLDMASVGGEVTQTLYNEFNGDVPSEKWEQYFKDMKIEELSSSYAYVVDLNTKNMLFHPTADKIGQPVSNSVILNLCDAVVGGKSFEQQDYVEYEFNGEIKMAAYSVVADNNCVLVISADKSDITSSVNGILAQTFLNSCIVLIVVLAVGIILIRRVMKDLDDVTDMVLQLSRFELTEDVAQTAKLCSKQSEIGDIARAVKALRESLRTTIASLRDTSGKLASYSMELSDNSTNVTDSMNSIDCACNEIAEGATSQAHSTEEATNAAVRMGMLIDDSIRAVDNLELVSQDVKMATDSAGNKLSEVNESNQKVTEVTEQIKVSILETSESAENIKMAADVITSIASQTNLLSLNASIEAARAGEAGRGFAVVASEISQLAEQSNQAAVQIRGIIDELIDNSNRSVEDIQAAKNITQEQTKHLNDAIGEFVKAKDGMEHSLREIGRVKASAEELDTAKEQVLDIVQALSAISEENAASTEETAASVTQAKSVVDDVAEKAGHVSRVAEILEEDANKWIM